MQNHFEISLQSQLSWRYHLARECLFYFRICRNWRAVCAGRIRGIFFDSFRLRGGETICFSGTPPFQIFQEIWRRQVYTNHGWMKSARPQTIVDIGANIGFFSLYAARKWKQAHVWAYEPAPGNFKLLEENVRSSHGRVLPFACAVTGRQGQIPFFLKSEAGWHSIYKAGAQETVMVESINLHDVFNFVNQNRIDLLKMDCEGAEYDLLEGNAKLLSAHVRDIVMEYHESNGFAVSRLLAILEQANFKYLLIPEPRWHTGMLYARNQCE